MTTQLLIGAAFLMLGFLPAIEPVNVSGHWTVTITTAGGKMTGKASLKQAGDKVTGQIGPREDATISIDGVVSGRKVTLKTHPRPGRTTAFDSCDLTVDADRMVGTIHGGDAGEGTIEFVRTGR